MLFPNSFLLCCQSASWVLATPGIWWGGCCQVYAEVGLPIGWLQAGSNTTQQPVCCCFASLEFLPPQSQIFMLLLKFSPGFKTLLVTPSYWLIWLVVIMDKLCHCYFSHKVTSCGVNTLRAVLGLLFTWSSYAQVRLKSTALIQAMLLRRPPHRGPMQVSNRKSMDCNGL